MLHASFIGIMSAFYAFFFIFTANHMEFTSMLANGTLQSRLWNNWSNFLATGAMTYVGYTIIALALLSFIIMFIKKTKRYDEYQSSILTKLLVIGGVISMIMLPLIMFMLLSDPNYTIETIFLFVTIQWLGILIANLYYVLKY